MTIDNIIRQFLDDETLLAGGNAAAKKVDVELEEEGVTAYQATVVNVQTINRHVLVIQRERIAADESPGWRYCGCSRSGGLPMRSSIFFRGRVQGYAEGILSVTVAGGLQLLVPSDGPISEDVTIALRPERIRIAPLAPRDDGVNAPNSISATVEEVVYRGFVRHYYLRLPNRERLIAFAQDQSDAASVQPGMQVRASWDAAGNHLIRDESPTEPDAAPHGTSGCRLTLQDRDRKA
jgi:hypothetical protein